MLKRPRPLVSTNLLGGHSWIFIVIQAVCAIVLGGIFLCHPGWAMIVLALALGIMLLGCGIQKGKTGYYRGVKIERMDLNPKVQVDIVVSAVPVRTLIEAAKKALYTGNIGDGKIFVYDVENVVKVRTGEEGYDALQGDEQF